MYILFFIIPIQKYMCVILYIGGSLAYVFDVIWDEELAPGCILVSTTIEMEPCTSVGRCPFF